MFFVIVAIATSCLACVSAQTCSLDPDGNAEKVDVLILGAGIAGISAARTLEVNGITDFLVLEATDRVGGRMREYDRPGKVPLEVGAHWIQGLDPDDPLHHPIWREWTRCDPDGPEGSVTPAPSAVYDVDGNPFDIEDEDAVLYNKINDFYSAFDAIFELSAVTINTSLREGFTMAGWNPNDSLDNFIEWANLDFCTANLPKNTSLKLYTQSSTYTDFTESDEEGENYLVADEKGFSFVVKCLARDFINDKVRVNSTVTRIKVADDCVCAEVKDGGTYCGKYGIMTFSAGVLQAAIRGDKNSVQFEPPLPKWKQDAINNISVVFYAKNYLVFPERFWNETDEDQQTFGYVADERGYYPYFILDKNLPNTIFVDVVQDLAIKVAEQTQEETVNEIMAILKKIFDNDTLPQPETAVISKWHLDPFFRHSYSDYGPGVPESVFDDLLRPVNGRLYFAGEALNRTNFRYTHGAYGTGVNAAEQIVTLPAEDSAGQSPFSIIVLCL